MITVYLYEGNEVELTGREGKFTVEIEKRLGSCDDMIEIRRDGDTKWVRRHTLREIVLTGSKNDAF